MEDVVDKALINDGLKERRNEFVKNFRGSMKQRLKKDNIIGVKRF